MSDILLPEGYAFESGNELLATDIMALRGSIGWGVESEAVWEECIAKSLVSLGVKELSTSKVVGVGFLTGSVRHSVLCDLVVHPSHQGRGVGKAILDYRIDAARRIGVRYIYTELSESNTLKDYYSDIGFVNTGRSLFLDLT